ncbi:carboxyl transferase domain-containing protein [Pseudonocardia sp. TRM90224]|uniref:carboxyl transferase domain-containing protein n=1 Tax=Pseudonocardia sp. TRM90224 TaxID=2812678 RepID=UPI001E5E138C|nr:carboxyl transferase domain-containing protein [Pseudonocardia sp. TRM90224]
MTGTAETLDAVLDPASFERWPESSDSVVAGAGTVAGTRVAVLLGDYSVHGGSIGVEASGRLAGAIRRATAERLPLLASPRSAGTRMQDGTRAFVGMLPITAAVTAHRRAGLPYLVWLRDPVFGGVLASWGSQGHVTAAEPGARIGFLGPRVVEALRGAGMPAGVQTAENLHRNGLVDRVLPLAQLRGAVGKLLGLLDTTAEPAAVEPGCPAAEPVGEPDAATAVARSRDPGRPGVRDVVADAGLRIAELHGTGRGETGPAVLLALADLGGARCVLIGQDRAAQADGHPVGPAELRVVRRGIALADELWLPIVTVVDSDGGELSVRAEEGGLAAEVGGCLMDLTSVTCLKVAVLLGQGAGGTAIALLAADRVLAARHAWLAPLPPEGASTILHGRPDRAPEMAAAQRIRAHDLARAGFVHRIVDERPDAAAEPQAFARRLVRAVGAELSALRLQTEGSPTNMKRESIR